jgi:hypothetical protein
MPVNRNLEAFTPRFQIFLAIQAIALGWVIRSACKGCAQRLLACARWLAPGAQRFLVQRIGARHQYQIKSEFAPEWSSVLYRMQFFRVVAGFLVVIVVMGYVTWVTVRKSPELEQSHILQLAPISRTPIEGVPLPTRKPKVGSKIAKKAGHQPLKKRMAQKKR